MHFQWSSYSLRFSDTHAGFFINKINFFFVSFFLRGGGYQFTFNPSVLNIYSIEL